MAERQEWGREKRGDGFWRGRDTGYEIRDKGDKEIRGVTKNGECSDFGRGLEGQDLAAPLSGSSPGLARFDMLNTSRLSALSRRLRHAQPPGEDKKEFFAASILSAYYTKS
jgi:hypothetical protein